MLTTSAEGFQMAFRMLVEARKKGMSTVELGIEIGALQQEDNLVFKKAQEATDSDEAWQLVAQKKNVEMDGNHVGGYYSGSPAETMRTKK
jgi:hypothetical protein